MNNFSVLGEGLADDINDNICTAEKRFSINFTKANTKFSLGLHYNCNERYM